jgi:hypothetical protein
MATARYALAGAGIRSAGLGFGGYTTATQPQQKNINSTIFSPATGAWASGGNMGTARNSLAGAGTQTAGLGFGGSTGSFSNATEEYDGSSWGPGGNMTTARSYYGRLWNSNSSFRIWWIYIPPTFQILMPQKNIMDQRGQVEEI